MKKITILLALAASIVMLTSCGSEKSTTPSKGGKSQAISNTKVAESSSASQEKSEVKNKDASDWVDFYGIAYKAPKNIKEIAGYYDTKSEYPVKIFPDGRFVSYKSGGSSNFGILENYFDENNQIQENPYFKKYGAYTHISQGRVIEQNGIDFLVPLADSSNVFLNNKAEPTFVFDGARKDDIIDILENKERFPLYSFVKDGLLFATASTNTEYAVTKQTANPDFEKVLDSRPLLLHDQSFPVKTLNQLLALNPNDINVQLLTSDELKSVDFKDKSKKVKLKFGFKGGSQHDAGYVSDGDLYYRITIDQLGLHAQ